MNRLNFGYKISSRIIVYDNCLLKQTIRLQLEQIQKANGIYDYVILDRTRFTYEVSALTKNKKLFEIFDAEINGKLKSTEDIIDEVLSIVIK